MVCAAGEKVESEKVDSEKVEATYRHGVLTVMLPKATSAQKRLIAVQAA